MRQGGFELLRQGGVRTFAPGGGFELLRQGGFRTPFSLPRPLPHPKQHSQLRWEKKVSKLLRAFSWHWWEGVGGVWRASIPPSCSFLLLPAKVRKSPRNFETSKPFPPSCLLRTTPSNQWSFFGGPQIPQSAGRCKKFLTFTGRSREEQAVAHKPLAAMPPTRPVYSLFIHFIHVHNTFFSMNCLGSPPCYLYVTTYWYPLPIGTPFPPPTNWQPPYQLVPPTIFFW